jgi:hypothetical protein
MAAISATQMTEATDKLGAYWLAVVGTDASGMRDRLSRNVSCRTRG